MLFLSLKLDFYNKIFILCLFQQRKSAPNPAQSAPNPAQSAPNPVQSAPNPIQSTPTLLAWTCLLQLVLLTLISTDPISTLD